MLSKARRFMLSLHEDESGPTTVEWIMLLIVGVIILAGIFVFARYMKGRSDTMQEGVESTEGEGAIPPP